MDPDFASLPQQRVRQGRAAPEIGLRPTDHDLGRMFAPRGAQDGLDKICGDLAPGICAEALRERQRCIKLGSAVGLGQWLALSAQR